MHPSENNPNFARRERSAEERSPITWVGEIPELWHSSLMLKRTTKGSKKGKKAEANGTQQMIKQSGTLQSGTKEQRGDLAGSLKTVSSADGLESNYSLFHKAEELEETKRSWQVKVQNK